MRVIAIATLLAATLASSGAWAQSGYVHHKYCLKTGPSTECAYQTFAQCKAAMRGPADTCVLNSAPINH